MSKLLALAGAAIVALVPATANAALDIDIDQVGIGVVLTVSGTLNISGLTYMTSSNDDYEIRANKLYIGTGSNEFLDGYSGFTGPDAIGPGVNNFNTIYAESHSGDEFAIAGVFPPLLVFVPRGFVSGDTITATETFEGETFGGETFATLGLAAGTYVYKSNADTITINVGLASAAAVPEATTWAMIIGGFGIVGAALRRRRMGASYA